MIFSQWMPLDEFREQPLIQSDNMFKKIIDICIARLGKKYCGLNVHPVVSKFDGKMSSLYYNIVDTPDSNCQTTSLWNASVVSEQIHMCFHAEDNTTVSRNFARTGLKSNATNSYGTIHMYSLQVLYSTEILLVYIIHFS